MAAALNLDGIQWARVAVAIRMKGETAVEESISLARDTAKLHDLLDQLETVDRGKAEAFFQALGVSAPTSRSNKRAVFSGFIQAAIGVPQPDISAWLLTVPYLGDKPNVLLVHNNDKVIPVSLFCCNLGSTGYLARNVAGSEMLQKVLGAN